MLKRAELDDFLAGLESLAGIQGYSSPDLTFCRAVAAWMDAVQAILDTYYSNNFNPDFVRPALAIDNINAPKNVRVIQLTYPDAPTREGQQPSAFAFIDRKSGDVLKSDGWSRPARGTRGNIYDPNRLGVDSYTGRIIYNK